MHYGARRLTRPAADFRLFGLDPLTGLIGAELDLDLTAPLSAEVTAELRRALLEWKVLFFRDQDLTPERHLEIARIWGEPEANPFFPRAGAAAISRLAKDARSMGMENIWHSDHSFLAEPARLSVLRAVEVPPCTGDTLWADMAAAYDNLPADVKSRIDALEAEHDWVASWGLLMTEEQIAELRERLPTVRHPVVKKHPETGRPTLYVNEPFTTRILGADDELLEYLRAQARVPEYQVRFRWAPGSVAIWDNWAVQHYAVNDYHPQPRVMERVAVAGTGWLQPSRRTRHPAARHT